MRCHNIAISGIDACRKHAGKKAELAKAQGQAVITAWNAMGGNPNIDYRMAVLGVLQMTWLRLSSYSELLRRQVTTEGDQAEPVTIDEDGVPQTSGLIGHRMSSSPAGLYATSEEVRALVSLEAAERDKVIKYAKTAHDMGISERLTSLAERWGDVVAGKISTMLTDPRLNLTPEQVAMIPVLINAHLGSIDVEAMSGGVMPAASPNGARGVRDGGGPSR